MRKNRTKKMNLSKETLRALEDRMIYEVVGGISIGTTNGQGVTCQASCVTDYTCVCKTLESNCC